MSKRWQNRNVNPVIAFAIINFVFVLFTILFFVLPSIQEIRNTRDSVEWQESQYHARAVHLLAYEDNLQEFKMLTAQRQLLNYYELAQTLSYISSLAEVNRLRVINFTAAESIGIYTYELDRILDMRIRMENEGYANDVLRFLYELESMSANVLAVDIAWERHSLARVVVEMSLFSF